MLFSCLALLNSPLLVFSGQNPSQDQRQDSDQKHETTTHGHSSDVVRLVAVRIKHRAHQGSELTEEVQHRHSRPSLRVRVLIVDGPGQYEGDGGEEARRSGIDACVSPPRARSERSRKSDGQVTRPAEDRVEDDVVASVPRAIRKECGE